MKIYVVIEDIDDYPEMGGGSHLDAVFLNYTNAEKYVKQKQHEADAWDDFCRDRISWHVETWETADERENEND